MVSHLGTRCQRLASGRGVHQPTTNSGKHKFACVHDIFEQRGIETGMWKLTRNEQVSGSSPLGGSFRFCGDL